MRFLLLSLITTAGLAVSAGAVQAQPRSGFRGGVINVAPGAQPNFSNMTFIHPRINVAPGGMANFNNSRLVNPQLNAAATAQLQFNNSLVVNRPRNNASPFLQQGVMFPNSQMNMIVPRNTTLFPSAGFTTQPFVVPSVGFSPENPALFNTTSAVVPVSPFSAATAAPITRFSPAISALGIAMNNNFGVPFTPFTAPFSTSPFTPFSASFNASFGTSLGTSFGTGAVTPFTTPFSSPGITPLNTPSFVLPTNLGTSFLPFG